MKENETKLIERYCGWMCEKCGEQIPRSLLESGLDMKTCRGCKRKIIDKVPLVEEAPV